MSLVTQNNLENPAIAQKAQAGGFGQVQLTSGGVDAAAPANQEFSAAYAVTNAVISYTSASNPNYGEASFTGVSIPEGNKFVAHMKTVIATTGTVLLDCLTENPDA